MKSHSHKPRDHCVQLAGALKDHGVTFSLAQRSLCPVDCALRDQLDTTISGLVRMWQSVTRSFLHETSFDDMFTSGMDRQTKFTQQQWFTNHVWIFDPGTWTYMSKRPGNRPSVFINFHVHGDVRFGENIGICHMFISWWCLLAPHFHSDLWKIIVLLQWDLNNACWTPSKNVTFLGWFQHAFFKSHCSKSMIFHKSQWKRGAKRHHHDINIWQIPREATAPAILFHHFNLRTVFAVMNIAWSMLTEVQPKCRP